MSEEPKEENKGLISWFISLFTGEEKGEGKEEDVVIVDESDESDEGDESDEDLQSEIERCTALLNEHTTEDEGFQNEGEITEFVREYWLVIMIMFLIVYIKRN